ncbi:head-tail connector protein [Salinicola sp. V024]|uniref:head-tail connector protein n=1 Tax=Salinicola sp. V024 TaxID=3459609 RepID=UPI0040444FC0
MFVTLEEAKNHLLVDHDEDDADIQLKILGASAAISNYITEPAYVDDEETEVKPIIKIATLVYVGILYRDRDSEKASEYDNSYPPSFVCSILHSLRQSTLV